ncbi:MAG: dihydroorotate dehydrogenase electron transfer subunit [Clostridia bacterium]|nr:dihydroorotate dehydrogenase electron transfer subunit [Clostridia bacterium]
MNQQRATVKENIAIAQNIYAITLTLSKDAGKITGGQFANISVGQGKFLLKRPLGICKVNGSDITLCYQLKGEGTRTLSQAKCGDGLDILLPLGNGFIIPQGVKNVAVIGGGVGIFPLISVINGHPDINFYSFIGFRNKDAVCLLDEFKKSKSLTITTDDGSFGQKGNAVSAYMAGAKDVPADLIIACGPPVMLRVLKEQLTKNNITTPCLVSLEERMGCGVGACLVCVCKKADGSNARVCKDGPVFNINEVEL